MEIEENLAAIEKLLNSLIEFAVTYGFQIIGVSVFLLIGLKVAGWAARRIAVMCETKGIDITLAKFIGSGVKRGEQIEGFILNDICYNIFINWTVRLRKVLLTL